MFRLGIFQPEMVEGIMRLHAHRQACLHAHGLLILHITSIVMNDYVVFVSWARVMQHIALQGVMLDGVHSKLMNYCH